jgi:RHS repeat-associated protein
MVTSTLGSSQSVYGYTDEYSDSYIKLIYLRSRMYDPQLGRFTTKDSWQGDYNRPLSLNRWMYTEGNPVNFTDPSGHFPVDASQILSQALSQYNGSSNNVTILNLLNDCLPESGNRPPQSSQPRQMDLTGYLALAMTKHGQDTRVKNIAFAIEAGSRALKVDYRVGLTVLAPAYLAFRELEASGKVWDIKINIRRELDENIVLCGTGINCHWFDYSTPGNIHFGYVAGKAKIDQFVAAIAGGILEQQDLLKKGLPLEPLYCFQNAFPGMCDNPQDQAAVDFGYELAKKYAAGISDADLRRELQINGMGNFQTNPHRYDEYWWQVYPETNHYGADAFNQ